MGVEYRHFLVVNDPDWRPRVDTVSRVEQVLRTWGLATRLEKAVDLTAGLNEELTGESIANVPDGGIAYVYQGVQGAAVAKIAGPSEYGVGDDERYTMRTTLVVGNDYRIQWSSESIYFELTSPPTEDGVPIEATDEEPFDILFDESFSSEQATSPPVVTIHVEEHAQANVGWDAYQGFWRAAVVIDFGKDLPAFSETRHELPERTFVSAVSEAFRGPIVEVGEFY